LSGFNPISYVSASDSETSSDDGVVFSFCN
jgi:hypothetical protein